MPLAVNAGSARGGVGREQCQSSGQVSVAPLAAQLTNTSLLVTAGGWRWGGGGGGCNGTAGTSIPNDGPTSPEQQSAAHKMAALSRVARWAEASY